MFAKHSPRPKLYHLALACTFILLCSLLAYQMPARADHTPPPSTVTLVGSLQTALGCAGDWDPGCSQSYLNYDAGDDVWQATFDLPAGSWEYKVALNNSWDENYGANGTPGGANIALNLPAATTVKFYYDHKSHWITDNFNTTIAVAPGSFQSELGCPGDWDPGCLRSWLQDVDGDGTFTASTTALPAGSYEFKVALYESWDINYGLGGEQNGPNVPFSVVTFPSTVTFSWDSSTHVPTVTVVGPGPGLDNDIWWDGVYHDSRSTLYRTPGGAVPSGTAVTLRLRTYHNDVSSVKLRLYDLSAGAQQILPMTRAADGVDCYQSGLPFTCDFWAITLPNPAPDNFWYRFILTDGTDTDYYADNTQALDGGPGAMSDDVVDYSYALMVYDPAFVVPDWANHAVIYQIFPDRFRDGRKDNNPVTGQVRYDDPVLKLPWGTLPEGYCRNYADGATNCPWRFDTNPPPWSLTKEGPRGRDYMGGDLKGVDQSLEYLASLGVNTLYFNPIFDSASNHGYDTQSYYRIDPYFGNQKDWENLVKHANLLGMRIILDGVFNHLSSDSSFFDRYHHYATVGACESVSSMFRDWFTFHDVPAGTGTCVGSAGPNSATYDGWFGFDSIPVLNKSNPVVQKYFLTNANSVSRYWLKQGASAWRLDVMGDASFPDGYWETFRQVVKGTDPNALIIGELWSKDSTTLRFLRGDRADSTMNYRLRDAVVGLLAAGPFDSKGFPDSGRILAPSEFAARIASIQEDYPAQVFYSLMNLVDSHDTERLLWTLTPGTETTADKELNPANLAIGKARQKIASLIQFTLPGAPTIYYGDELAQTGDDDPDNRRTYPALTLAVNGDPAMFVHYKALGSLRQANAVLTSGDLRILLADDAAGTVAYGRKTSSQAAVIVINRSDTTSPVSIPVAGYLPDGLVLQAAYTTGAWAPGSVTVANGVLQGTIDPLSAVVLLTGQTDLLPPAAPAGLLVTSEGDGTVSLAWTASPDAVSYNVYRSPLSGGGFVNIGQGSGTSFDDHGLTNGRTYFYVVTALDGVGNESAFSNQVSALPHYTIGWANLQWPPSMSHTISIVNRTDTAYGQVWIDGVTSQPGATPTLWAQLGFGPEGSNPASAPGWTWVDAGFNVDAGNNDEFMASMLPETTGVFDYVYRYTTTGGRDWLYADLNGPVPQGNLPVNPGKLTVNPSGDSTPPAIPSNLLVTSASPAGINLAWDAVLGDPTLYGYEVLRSGTTGGPYTLLALTTANSYSDTAVTEGATYYYVVRSIDMSFNRSGFSTEVSATAELRTVSLNFNVTVPANTDGTGRSVYIAGTLSRLDGGMPDWNPGAVVLSRLDATHWTISLTGLEGVQIEYKYTLGDWDHVEKDGSCGEIANRTLTLSYGSDGVMNINDTVLNWRNVSPCGN